MRKTAMWKDIFREIWKSKARFLSIFAIILMGVAFFAGLIATGPVMRETADHYYDDNNLMDIQVQSTFGLEEEDMEILQNIPDATVEGIYSVDVLLEQEDYATKLFGYNEDQDLNNYIVTEGRLPEESGEIALDANESFTQTYEIGDMVRINENTDDNFGENFSQTEFEVTGFVQSPRYIVNSDRGNTTIGSGILDGYGVIREEDYTIDYFTEANVRFNQTDQMNVYSDEYQQMVTNQVEELETQFEDRAGIRYEEIQQNAQEEINQGQEEIDNARQQLEEAEQSLQDGREELDQGWETYNQGQEELNEQSQIAQEEFASRRQEIDSARSELEQRENQLNEAQNQIDQGRRNLNQTVYELDLPGLEQRIETGRLELEQGRNNLEQGQLAIDNGRLALDEAQAAAQEEFQVQRQEIESGQSAISQARQQLNTGQEELDQAQDQVDSAADQGQSMEGSINQLDEAQTEIDSAYEELNLAEKELNVGENNLQTNLSEAKNQLVESQASLNDTQTEIDQLKTELKDIKNPEGSENQESSEGSEGSGNSENLENQEGSEDSENPEGSEDSETSEGSENPESSEDIENSKDPEEQESSQDQKDQARIEELEADVEGLESQIPGLEAKVNNQQTQVDKITQNLSELQDQKEELSTSREELDRRQEELDRRRADVNSLLSQLEGQDFQSIQEELGNQQAQLDQAREELNSRQGQLESGTKLLNQAEHTAQNELQNTRDQLNQAQMGVDTGFEALNQAESELNAGASQLQVGNEQIDSARQQLAAFENSLEQGRAALGQGMSQLSQGEQTLNEAESGVEEQLSQGQAELDEGRDQLQQGETEFQDGLQTYQEESSTAEEEIAQGEEDLRQAQEDLDNLEEPTYIVNDHSDMSGISEFGENANRIDAIATIFPVFFFLLAILISLTTMTRMVDEERNQIGTMKALGYSNVSIATKYYVYAFIATLIGGLLGLIIGYWLFPGIIMDAYSTMYTLPSANTRWFWSYSLISLFGALIATGLATHLSARSLLKNNAASLLRPKAPKIGKRILLERIPFIWNRMSFTQKVSSRNLFRYKGRMFMTIFGVAGGVALLLTGFGLSDSISKVNPIQFDELYQYDATVSKDPNASEGQLQSLDETIDSSGLVNSQIDLYQTSGTAISEDSQLDVSLMVPEDAQDFQDFIILRDRDNEENVYELPSDGAIITEKLAEMTNVEAGDTLTITDNSENEYEVPVSGVVEHYVGHNVYMSQEAYSSIIGNEPENNTSLLNYGNSDFTEKDQEELGDTISEEDAAMGVFFQTAVNESFQDSLESLNVVTVVLIVSAGALAFVVLYNLTNINISERIRELSTIKVLGFYDIEVTKYVYRENIALTVMGILAGFVLGFFMHQFVIATAEVDMMKFVTEMDLTSYLYSALLMLLFSLIVGVVMHFKLKNVDMVEALKAED